MSKPDGTAKKISENAVWMKAVAAGSIDELQFGGGRCDSKNKMMESSQTIPQSISHGAYGTKYRVKKSPSAEPEVPKPVVSSPRFCGAEWMIYNS